MKILGKSINTSATTNTKMEKIWLETSCPVIAKYRNQQAAEGKDDEPKVLLFADFLNQLKQVTRGQIPMDSDFEQLALEIAFSLIREVNNSIFEEDHRLIRLYSHNPLCKKHPADMLNYYSMCNEAFKYQDRVDMFYFYGNALKEMFGTDPESQPSCGPEVDLPGNEPSIQNNGSNQGESIFMFPHLFRSVFDLDFDWSVVADKCSEPMEKPPNNENGEKSFSFFTIPSDAFINSSNIFH